MVANLILKTLFQLRWHDCSSRFMTVACIRKTSYRMLSTSYPKQTKKKMRIGCILCSTSSSHKIWVKLSSTSSVSDQDCSFHFDFICRLLAISLLNTIDLYSMFCFYLFYRLIHQSQKIAYKHWFMLCRSSFIKYVYVWTFIYIGRFFQYFSIHFINLVKSQFLLNIYWNYFSKRYGHSILHFV